MKQFNPSSAGHTYALPDDPSTGSNVDMIYLSEVIGPGRIPWVYPRTISISLLFRAVPIDHASHHEDHGGDQPQCDHEPEERKGEYPLDMSHVGELCNPCQENEGPNSC